MKSKKQVYDLAKKHQCSIDIVAFDSRESLDDYADYDIVIDAPEGKLFTDRSAIVINNSFLENCNTADVFWNMAYTELENELKYLEEE